MSQGPRSCGDTCAEGQEIRDFHVSCHVPSSADKCKTNAAWELATSSSSLLTFSFFRSTLWAVLLLYGNSPRRKEFSSFWFDAVGWGDFSVTDTKASGKNSSDSGMLVHLYLWLLVLHIYPSCYGNDSQTLFHSSGPSLIIKPYVNVSQCKKEGRKSQELLPTVVRLTHLWLSNITPYTDMAVQWSKYGVFSSCIKQC